MDSKISVIIPAYGNQHALDLSLATLYPQRRFMKSVGYDRFECIVVDDGSDPQLNIPDWCVAAEIPRKAVHRGSSAAKNFGAKLATGDYLSFCDSDILHLPDALESLLECMHQWESEGSPDMLLNTMRVSLPDGYKDKYLTDLDRLMTKCRAAGLLNDEDMLTSAWCYEQNESLIRREFFVSLGGYDEKGFPSWGLNNQDLDLRVVLAGGRMSSAIKRVTDGKRLHCFHQFHENHCDKQKAMAEFESKWGDPWSDVLFMQIRAMVESGGVPKRKPMELACQSS